MHESASTHQPTHFPPSMTPPPPPLRKGKSRCGSGGGHTAGLAGPVVRLEDVVQRHVVPRRVAEVLQRPRLPRLLLPRADEGVGHAEQGHDPRHLRDVPGGGGTGAGLCGKGRGATGAVPERSQGV